MLGARGISPDLLPQLRGDYDLGWNATGVIRSYLHISEEEIIIREEMPGVIVDEVFASVARLQDSMKRRRPGGYVKAQIPLPLHSAWRRMWAKGPRLHGVTWKAYITMMIEDRDYRKFLVRR